jgi:outer membrane receptor protein involved in Fe transport
MSEGYDKIRNLTRTRNAKQFSQELRIASPRQAALEYVAGLFYADSKNDKRPSPPSCRIRSCRRRRCRARSSPTPPNTPDETKALFGQTTFRLTEATSLIAGLRYTRDRVSDYESVQRGQLRRLRPAGLGQDAPAAARAKPMSPASSACSTRSRATPTCTPP